MSTVTETPLSVIDQKLTAQIKEAEEDLKFLKNQLKNPDAFVGVELKDPEFIYTRTWSEVGIEDIDQGDVFPFIQTCQDLIEYVASVGGTFHVNSATAVEDGTIDPEDDICYEEGSPEGLEWYYFFDTSMDGGDSKDKYVSVDWSLFVPKSKYDGLMEIIGKIDTMGDTKLV